jgi:hypothetical protein
LYEKSYQLSAVSFQPRPRIGEGDPHVGCALRTMPFPGTAEAGCPRVDLYGLWAFA